MIIVFPQGTNPAGQMRGHAMDQDIHVKGTQGEG